MATLYLLVPYIILPLLFSVALALLLQHPSFVKAVVFCFMVINTLFFVSLLLTGGMSMFAAISFNSSVFRFLHLPVWRDFEAMIFTWPFCVAGTLLTALFYRLKRISDGRRF